jgi:hypothetical protein
MKTGNVAPTQFNLKKFIPTNTMIVKNVEILLIVSLSLLYIRELILVINPISVRSVGSSSVVSISLPGIGDYTQVKSRMSVKSVGRPLALTRS